MGKAAERSDLVLFEIRNDSGTVGDFAPCAGRSHCGADLALAGCGACFAGFAEPCGTALELQEPSESTAWSVLIGRSNAVVSAVMHVCDM
jgi:hypothetical protein